MKRFIAGADRQQTMLLPDCLDDYVTSDNPVRLVEMSVDELDLTTLGFAGAVPEATGRPAYRKADGQECRLCFMGHALMENHNGSVADATLTHATDTAERDTALAMLDRRQAQRTGRCQITLGANQAYDVAAFALCRVS